MPPQRKSKSETHRRNPACEWADVLIDGKPLKVSVEDGEITILVTNEETGKEYGGDEWQNVGIDLEPILDFVKALGIILAEHEGNMEIFMRCGGIGTCAAPGRQLLQHFVCRGFGVAFEPFALPCVRQHRLLLHLL